MRRNLMRSVIGAVTRSADGRIMADFSDSVRCRGLAVTPRQRESIVQYNDISTSLKGGLGREHDTPYSTRGTDQHERQCAVHRPSIATSAGTALSCAAGMESAREAEGRAQIGCVVQHWRWSWDQFRGEWQQPDWGAH